VTSFRSQTHTVTPSNSSPAVSVPPYFHRRIVAGRFIMRRLAIQLAAGSGGGVAVAESQCV